MTKLLLSRVAVSLFGTAIAGTALVGCDTSAAENNESSTNSITNVAEDATGRDIGPDGQLLPAGVMAPVEPAPPGSARLGPDGHYDYSAPDFVLGDPCEDQELMSRLAAQGWEIGTSSLARFSNSFARGCSLAKAGSLEEPLTIVNFRASYIDFKKRNAVVASENPSSTSWFLVAPQSEFGDMCAAISETHLGSTGFVYTYNEATQLQDQSSACNFASSKFNEFMEGKHEFFS